MPKPIAITTDSPADLSPELAQRYGVSVIPLYITLDDKSYRDGVDITPGDIFRAYEDKNILPTTSAIPIADYLAFFRSFTEKGMAVVHLSLSSEISSTHQNAVLAARELEKVYVTDSRSLSVGIALLVIKACEMRDAGFEAAEIVDKLKTLRELACTSFVLDKLEFLRKGGRCSALTALGANVLGIRPSIQVQGGTLHVDKKYRGKIDTVQLQYAKDRLEMYNDIDLDRIFLCHSGTAPEQLKKVKDLIIKTYPFREVIVSHAGCTISTHCGPNCMGLLFMLRELK